MRASVSSRNLSFLSLSPSRSDTPQAKLPKAIWVTLLMGKRRNPNLLSEISPGLPGSSTTLAILLAQVVEGSSPQAFRKASLPRSLVPPGTFDSEEPGWQEQDAECCGRQSVRFRDAMSVVGRPAFTLPIEAATASGSGFSNHCQVADDWATVVHRRGRP